ncbi:MAG: hypothetical protein V3V49_01835 [Candidatus Krumholzibacteria bacterium]
MRLRRFEPKLWLVVSLVGVVAFVAPGCGDDETTGPTIDMVTIAGMVMNVDTGEPAPGIRVSLLDTPYADDLATGTDGAFELQVPRGSELLLKTDDFNRNRKDDWFPLINVEVPTVVANGNMLNWRIHACPVTQCADGDTGSVAYWDNYLQNGDQNNGDIFVPTNSAFTSGVITVIYWFCDNGVETSPAGLSVTTNVPEFPVCYMKEGTQTWFPELVCTSPDVVYPASRATTDSSGWVMSFGDRDFTGDTVELTLTDTDPQRGFVFPPPFDIPVRPGTLTAVFALAVDGVPNKTVVELLTCFGWM